MKAILFKGKDQPLVLQEMDSPRPAKDHVLIRLHAAALNHRDVWIRREQILSTDKGIVLGSDGSGMIAAVGEEGDVSSVGRAVVINPSHDWGNNPLVQGDAFKILGFPDHGTFAEYIVIHKKYVHDKPAHLTLEEAAAVPLSGLTAYRALFTKARLRPGEKVLITGIGGGAALWAFQLALAFQAKVYVTSSSAEKIARALQMGAVEGFNYREADWTEKAKRATRGFDVIIDSAGGAGFTSLLDVAAPGARVVIFGRTAGAIPDLAPRQIFWKQLSVMGTTMGTRDEFLSLLDFIEKRQVKPVVDAILPLAQAEQAMERMERGDQFGKIVLKISE
ncbi:MAG: zinc-binding dehydrogenase [Bacteroidota bacterium]